MLAYLLALFCLTLLHSDTDKLTVIMSLLCLVSRQKSHVRENAFTQSYIIAAAVLSFPVSEFQEEVCGYRREPTSCIFFFKGRPTKSLGHVYWLVTLLQAFRKILGKLWLFSGDKWSDCRPQTCSAETSTYTFRHQVPSTVIPSSICGQCPPMTPCMLILKADFWTWELKIPILFFPKFIKL